MSWVGLADNQIVSFNNLQDAVNNGYFTALTTIPVSNEEITKTDASTYVNCWTGYSLFANKASNQLIAKRDLVTTTSTTTTTTTAATTTSTTTTTTTIVTCNFYTIEGAASIEVEWLECDGTTNSATVTTAILICAQTGSVTQTGGAGNITQLGTCTGSPTTSTTTTTTTAATTTTSTTTTTTTAATTTTTTTSTTTTTTTLLTNITFDATTSACGYYITAVNVNGVAATLTGGAGLPFCTDTHNFNTTQTGNNETLNITVGSYVLNGCLTVVDSALNTYQQNVNGNGTYAFAGITINNTTQVVVTVADNFC